MKDAEFAALLEKLKKSVQERTRDKINEAMGYLAGYSDAIDEVRRAYTQAEGKGGSHYQAHP